MVVIFIVRSALTNFICSAQIITMWLIVRMNKSRRCVFWGAPYRPILILVLGFVRDALSNVSTAWWTQMMGIFNAYHVPAIFLSMMDNALPDALPPLCRCWVIANHVRELADNAHWHPIPAQLALMILFYSRVTVFMCARMALCPKAANKFVRHAMRIA